MADEIGHAIHSNSLKPGERLPTQREVAALLGVTVGTVNRAYLRARRQGWVVTMVGSGTYVPATVARPVSGRITEQMRDSLGAGLGRLAENSSFADELVEFRRSNHGSVEEAGRQWLQEAGVEVPVGQVFTFAGSQHALNSVFAGVLRRGEEIICEELTFPGVAALTNVLGLTLLPARIDEEGVIPEAVEELCRVHRPKALYTVPTLQMPTMAIMGKERRSELVRVARQYDLLIIEDDPHSRIVRENALPLAALAPERTIYVSDATNSLCPALRCSFLSAPVPYLADVQRGQRTMLVAVPGIEPRLIADWILEDGGEKLLASRREDLRNRHAIAQDALREFKTSSHSSSSLVWLELPGGFRTSTVVDYGATLGLEIQPLEAFAVSKITVQPSVLISLGAISPGPELAAALADLARFLSRPTTDVPPFDYS